MKAEASKKEAVRSAESSRKSSCVFADQVASLCVETFREICPSDLSYDQTCLAAMVMLLPSDFGGERLVVLSLGVGTKTLGLEALCAEKRRMAAARHHATNSTGEESGGGECCLLLRDFHAEVLARRGFKKWVVASCQSAASSLDGVSANRVITRNKEAGRFELHPGVTFHM
jgi:hypothetical protein